MLRNGQLKQVTVWLVLLGFLCAMMVPSDSFARVFRDIETEGDPGDGNEFEGGSGSGGFEFLPPTSKIVETEDDLFYVTLVPVLKNGRIEFRVEIISMERGG